MIRSTSGKSRDPGDVIIHTVTGIIEMSCYTILILLHPTLLPHDPFAVLNSLRKKMLGCQKFIVVITGRFELPSEYMQFAERNAPLSLSLSTPSNIRECHGEVSLDVLFVPRLYHVLLKECVRHETMGSKQ